MTANVESKAEQQIEQQKIEAQADNKPEPKEEQQQENKDGQQEDPNWKAFREARKRDRAEREAAEQRAREKEAEVAALKAAMEAAFSKPNLAPQQQYYGQPGEYQQEDSEDLRIEKKVQQALTVREAQLERERQEREQREYPNRLAQTFSDFHQTISQDNLDYLDYHYPEVSRPLQRLQDGYDKWSDIYRAIKKFVPNHGTAKKDAAKADANFNKPKSMASSSITQPGDGRSNARISEERKAANWARMQALLKGVG